MDQARIDHMFTYHPPNRLEDLARFAAIRQAGKYFAHVVNDNTPSGGDQTAAIFKIRHAVMLANASIACHQPGPSNPKQIQREEVGVGQDATDAYPPRSVLQREIDILRKQLAEFQAR